MHNVERSLLRKTKILVISVMGSWGLACHLSAHADKAIDQFLQENPPGSNLAISTCEPDGPVSINVIDTEPMASGHPRTVITESLLNDQGMPTDEIIIFCNNTGSPEEIFSLYTETLIAKGKANKIVLDTVFGGQRIRSYSFMPEYECPAGELDFDPVRGIYGCLVAPADIP